jgi:hypothetical protein
MSRTGTVNPPRTSKIRERNRHRIRPAEKKIRRLYVAVHNATVLKNYSNLKKLPGNTLNNRKWESALVIQG